MIENVSAGTIGVDAALTPTTVRRSAQVRAAAAAVAAVAAMTSSLAVKAAAAALPAAAAVLAAAATLAAVITAATAVAPAMTRPLPSPRRHPPQLPLRSASRNPATQRNSGDGRFKESAGGGASSSRRGPPPRATRVSASVVSTCAEVTNLALAVTTATPRLVTAAGCGGAARCAAGGCRFAERYIRPAAPRYGNGGHAWCDCCQVGRRPAGAVVVEK